MQKISSFHLVLLTMGSVIGCGWLFSPYYGYQIAGIGVLLSWLISACIVLFVGYSFSIVGIKLPVVGGVARFASFTHDKTTAFIFLFLCWLGYVVYAPIEVQSVVQYLSFWGTEHPWLNGLTTITNDSVVLSHRGLGFAIALLVLVTWFNSLAITKVAKSNTVITLWKIAIPLVISLVVIICFGHFSNILLVDNFAKFNMENVFLAITSSGIAFAFSGFQNGLILSNSAKNPIKSLKYSLYVPILLGVTIYMLLSISFMAVNFNQATSGAAHSVAPLLALVGFLGLNYLFVILFADAIVSPLGATNVFVAVTARILYGLGLDFANNTFLTHENKNRVPVFCLWINAFVGVFFLLPMPTWQQLVTFLSSVVIFSYMPGPMSLLALTKSNLLSTEPKLQTRYTIVGYMSFVFCSLLIYWSGLNNLFYLTIAIILVSLLYRLVVNKQHKFGKNTSSDIVLVLYLLVLSGISWIRHHDLILFPLDNFLVIASAVLFCYFLTCYRLSETEIKENIDKIN